MADWSNKVTVICGGSSGLGLSVARALVRQQCSLLVLIGRDSGKLNTAKAELTSLVAQISSRTRIETISADLTSKSEAHQCAGQLKLLTPKIDLMVQLLNK